MLALLGQRIRTERDGARQQQRNNEDVAGGPRREGAAPCNSVRRARQKAVPFIPLLDDVDDALVYEIQKLGVAKLVVSPAAPVVVAVEEELGRLGQDDRHAVGEVVQLQGQLRQLHDAHGASGA